MEQHKPSPFEIIASTLRRFGMLLRAFATVEGLFLWLILVGALLWISFGLDFFLEPSLLVRKIQLGLLIAIFVGGFAWFLLWRFAGKFSLSSLALLIEARKPELKDRLITAVELPLNATPFSDTLIQKAASEAADVLATFSIGTLLQRNRIVKVGAGALILIASIALGIWARPVLAGVWKDRVFLLGQSKYPRSTHLLVQGFENGQRKIARGRDFELLVSAEPTSEQPESVRFKYRMKDSGARGKGNMTKVGSDKFRQVFRNVLEPMVFEVRGGDETIEDLTLIPVEPPMPRSVAVKAEFPKYTGLVDKEFPATGAPISLPAGSHASVLMKFNKPIAELNLTANGAKLPATKIDDLTFSAKLVVATDYTVKAAFVDIDGIAPEEPFPIDLLCIEDRPPKIDAALKGIGPAITRTADIPVQFKAEDEYGIQALNFEFGLDALPKKKAPINLSDPTQKPDSNTAQANGARPRTLESQARFDVLPLQLVPGGKLNLSLLATDVDVLRGPHIGRSEEFAFEIVTPEELLSRLATRELNLRQRFEQVIRELNESRRDLNELRSSMADSSEKTISTRRLYLDRDLLAVRKNANDCASIAEGFRDILAELKNNRVGNSAMLERIENGVIDPLDKLAQSEFPEADQLLQLVQQVVAEKSLTERLPAAEACVDRILARCATILAAMRKLESFNEAVAILRKLIEDEQSLIDKTKKELRSKILDADPPADKSP